MTSSGSESAATGEGVDQQMAEKAVTGAAVHDWPLGARAQVPGKVRNCDFTDPRAAATWRALEYLAEHDAPIDEIAGCLRPRCLAADRSRWRSKPRRV